MTHQSWFSYSLSRPFPFRWFTPVAITGGIVFASLFTFLNFASSSYELIVKNSLNPNKTVADGNIDWPSFLTAKVRPTCQPSILPVNSQFFTNQTALKYTLADVWQTNEQGGDRAISPSLTYHNNVLEKCTVNSIDMDMASLDRSGNQFALAEWGIVVRSSITCQMMTLSGLVHVNLTQTYDYIPENIRFADIDQFLGTGFLSRDQTTRASLWWGESLMSTYWSSISWLMQKERANKTDNRQRGIRRGTVSLISNSSFSDLNDMKYFNIDYRFMVDFGNALYDVVCCPQNIPLPLSPESLAAESQYPNIWKEVDILAKSVYSTIMVDLGQTGTQANILTDEALLAHFTEDLGKIDMANFEPGPANDSYSNLKGITGPLGISPSVISTTYICQVPRLKSGGSLFVAILVADLVLLQAVWQLYKLAAETYLAKQQPNANYCPGCLGALDGGRFNDGRALLVEGREMDGEYIPLKDLSSTYGSRGITKGYNVLKMPLSTSTRRV